MAQTLASSLIHPKQLTLPGDPEFEAWRRTHPPIAGGVGWSVGSGTFAANNNGGANVVGTTGLSQTLGSVATGEVVVSCATWFTATSTGIVPTYSDTAGNVTTWNTAGNAFLSAAPVWISIGWGIATTTGTCTPKVTWNDSASAHMGVFVADFVAPSGTVSQDGTMATSNVSTSQTALTAPTSNGTGSNDLLVAMVVCGASFTSFSAPWSLIANTGDGAGYILNSSGAVALNATQSPASTYEAGIACLKVSGPTTMDPIPTIREFPQQTFGPF